MSGISPLEAVKLLEAQTMEHLDGEHLGSTGIATVAGNLGLSMEGATEAVESLRQRTVQMMEGQFGPPTGLSAGLLGAFVAGAIWGKRGEQDLPHVETSGDTRYVLTITTANGALSDSHVTGGDALELLAHILTELHEERPFVGGKPVGFRPPILVSIEEAE